MEITTPEFIDNVNKTLSQSLKSERRQRIGVCS